MAARLVATIAAEAAALDALTNRFTAFNILEMIVAPRMPAVMPRIVVLALYEIDPSGEGDEFHERVRLCDSAGATLIQTQCFVSVKGRKAGQGPNAHRSVHALWGTVFREFGEYALVVERSATGAAPWVEIGRRILLAVEGQLPLQARPPDAATGEQAGEESVSVPGPEAGRRPTGSE